MNPHTIKILKRTNWTMWLLISIMLIVPHFTTPVLSGYITPAIFLIMGVIYIYMIASIKERRMQIILLIVPILLITLSIPLSRYREQSDYEDALAKMEDLRSRTQKRHLLEDSIHHQYRQQRLKHKLN